jgi:hypothetical protein
MHAERRLDSNGSERQRRRRCRPRVVIFHASGTACVEVLQLPEDACPGHRICHGGRDWLITGSRTGSRVLIAEPEAN